MQMPPFDYPFHGRETLKKPMVLLISGFLVLSLAACGEKKQAGTQKESDGQVKVLATVNGAPITEIDVRQSFRRSVHGETEKPEAVQNVLQTLVNSELMYQQALDLGLDKNPGYRLKLHEAEAQLKAFQRQEMAILYREHVKNQAKVTDPEAQAYFDNNSNKIRTKYHLYQIYYKGADSRIVQDYKELKSGKPFEKVAAKRFPNLPKNVPAPWDLGYLHWNQIPPPWQGVVDRLEPGQASDIIKGAGERFWIIKLADKTVDPNITFATEKEKIVDVLQKRKAEELYGSMIDRMKSKSKIVFTK
ncbi:MAG: hypothetical protein FIA93_07745 [Deltaproteobacteria bacterium]|nr:hypothetical protein [Deltaproteobacteria bacterium]